MSQPLMEWESRIGRRVRLRDLHILSTVGVEPTRYADALLRRGRVVFDELTQGMREIEFLADPTVGEVRIGCPEISHQGLCRQLSKACRNDIPRSRSRCSHPSSQQRDPSLC